jgi:hypothetical protein
VNWYSRFAAGAALIVLVTAAGCGGGGGSKKDGGGDAGCTIDGSARKSNGATCGCAADCQSGFCVDGVCCNLACDQTCYACDLPGSVGTCNPIPEGQERGATPECPAQDIGTCGRIGGCNGRGACRLFTTEAVCGAQSCNGSVQTDVRHCNGVGGCDPPATRDCGAYVCNAAACFTTCTTAAQCKPGFTCAGAACRLIKITNLAVHDTVAANAALWGIVDQFQIGMAAVHPWGDAMWKDTYVKSIDATGNFLLTKQWIKVAAESKKYAGGPQATITLAAASDVYLVVDDRWGATPSWLMGWTNTGIHFQIWEVVSSKMFQFTLWKKAGATGMLDLPKIGASTAYDYFIIVD